MTIVPQDNAHAAVRRMLRVIEDHEARMGSIGEAVAVIDRLGKSGAPSETFRSMMHARRHLLRALELEGQRAAESVEVAWIMRDTENERTR